MGSSGDAAHLLRGFECLDARREDEVVDGGRDRRTGELRADVEGGLFGGGLVAPACSTPQPRRLRPGLATAAQPSPSIGP